MSLAATESQAVVFSSSREGSPDVRLLHYNDVYHIESGSAEPVGGIARFQTVVNEYRSDSRFTDQPSLVNLFSGDAYNPSLESSVTKGRHMVPILNAIGTDVACVGNHDLDFGITQFRHLRTQCRSPWLLANVLDPALGENVCLANCEKTTILTTSNGIKIGVIGLAEEEWLATINSLPPNLIFKSASETAQELVPALRDQGCELIVALTHMREPNDIKLAENATSGLIDLVLGGHDHYYNHEIIKSTHVLRSGSDFKQLSYIEGWKKEGGGWDMSVTRRDIVRAIPEDPSSLNLVGTLTSKLKVKIEKPIGYTAAPLDGRFTTVRTRESNLGNFVCDLMRYYYNTDCALMAGGTIRGDQIYPPGILRLKDIMNCFPFEDPVVVLLVTGKALHEALENSVSLVPALEGRYPQVSNITFEYHPGMDSGSRVQWAKVNNEPLDPSKMYSLATRGYMARGKDGFDSLLAKSEGGQAEEIVSEENGVLISTILRQYFLSLKVVGKWRQWSPSLHRHWDGIHSQLHQEGRIKEPTGSTASDGPRRPPKAGRHHQTSSTIPTGHHNQIAENAIEREPVDSEMVDTDSDLSEADYDHPSSAPLSGHPLVSNSSALPDAPISLDKSERLYHLARQVAKKWMRLAGVNREGVGMVDEAEAEFTPSWTKGIAPKIEGRIIISKNNA